MLVEVYQCYAVLPCAGCCDPGAMMLTVGFSIAATICRMVVLPSQFYSVAGPRKTRCYLVLMIVRRGVLLFKWDKRAAGADAISCL